MDFSFFRTPAAATAEMDEIGGDGRQGEYRRQKKEHIPFIYIRQRYEKLLFPRFSLAYNLLICPMSYNSLRTSKNINKTKFIRLMKTFRLLIVALLLAGSASAQRYERRAMRGEYSPTVYLISVQEVDTIYNYGPYAMQQAAALNRMAMDNATQDYIETHRPGFQQVEKPQFVFATKNNRFSFSLVSA